MKYSIITIILCVCVYSTNAQSCFPNGITFNTQSELNQFIIDNPNCSEIGSITVTGEDIVDLSPLNNIEKINGDFTIINNPSLLSISNFSNLAFLDGDLFIAENNALVTLGGFNSLIQLDGFLVGNNEALVSIVGFDNVSVLNVELNIGSNPSLAFLNCLNNLLQVKGQFLMRFLPSLLHLGGFNSLTSIEGRMFLMLSELIQVTAFSSLTNVGGTFRLNTFSKVTSLVGFNNLQTIGEAFIIENSDSLVTLDDFHSLTIINGSLQIPNNFSLKSIEGLSSLKEIYGDISIDYNDNLTSLKGLQNIDYTLLDDLILIDNNPNLSVCSVKPICDYINTPELHGEVLAFFDNAPGCNSVDEVLENCTGDTTSRIETICEGESIILDSTEYSEFGFYSQNIINCLGHESLLKITVAEKENCGGCIDVLPTLNLQIAKNKDGLFTIRHTTPALRNKRSSDLLNLHDVVTFIDSEMINANRLRNKKSKINLDTIQLYNLLEKLENGTVLKL